MRSKALSVIVYVLILAVCCSSCRHKSTAVTAFYYWKTTFKLNNQQAALMRQSPEQHIYLHFFDINWNDKLHRTYPNAVIRFADSAKRFKITPVIYITNKTFDNIADTAINTLAKNCDGLVNRIVSAQHITCSTVQFDCDWSLTTRQKYFNFLVAFRKLNHCQLEATIRLHQVKYKQQTGVPPVDKGVLMFYNMGKLDASLRGENSIYNEDDAERYVTYAKAYPLKLDVALPLFSWAIHIRDGRVIQVYEKLDQDQLSNTSSFLQLNHSDCYRAKRSFFLSGIYIKQNDIFKLEQTTVKSLHSATKQLVKNLPEQANRTIIYYELANINPFEFTPEAIEQVSARF